MTRKPDFSFNRRFLPRLLRAVLAVSFCTLAASAMPAGESLWKAGVAASIITPAEPMWMAGYGGRTHPAEGKEMDLRLKALALEDAAGHRALIVTSDLLGIPQNIYQDSCAALKAKLGLEPEQIMLTASHTHCGPVLRKSLMDVYGLDATQRSYVEAYSRELETKILATAEEAFSNLAPARLASGQGTAGFAVNRRNNVEGQAPALIAQRALRGPVDHSVPVLAVYSPEGALKCLLFGYACHNTVMGYYRWSGDYAGFAQIALEKSHPGATAMFFMGCGGDQNPLPRHELSLAERYGEMLAAAVEEVLLSPPQPLAPELETSMEMADLPLGPAPTQSELENLQSKTNALPTDVHWAARLLAQMKAGQPFIRSYPYPIQVWRFGSRQLLISLGGEPVADYAVEFKSEFGSQTWVAGYCNDVMAYIPSFRVLKEDETVPLRRGWGYEGARSLRVYGLPAWRWDDSVQDQISAAVLRLTDRLQSPSKKH